ncbi:selenocysteine-specific translation elongation factor [Dethiothermospora halolimnae]|uniref:selenocysteine-specific translation elongation factor n=1 Tax=Dethiothermospora halolimnae TaxID=3114390 RepID=UPI003CCC0743
MKNVIVGTAGHIDHGKTTLIRALTGRNTDRLKQEQDRGISIELGFTFFDLPSGKRAGIIDVPGHEKFIKNMLAGVIGMDIVVLVVAADEGIMPQTTEHLDILNLLDIENGIIVLTKSDLVDDEWLELVKEDVLDNVKGTFLEDSPIIPVSSTKGAGVDDVIKTIDKLTDSIKERDITDTPRLPIDRVFTITGFGTVVTGTLVSGQFSEGDEVQVFPGNKVGRIRSIQVHEEDTTTAYAGQRVAINIAGLKKSEIDRGNIVAPIGSMEDTMMLDVKLKLLKNSQRIIENRTRVRIYLGTSEVLCRVVLLDKEHLTPGESCYAQLRLEDTIVAKRGDRFIMRFYSPMTTIGGGEILDSNPPKRKRFDNSAIEELKIKEKGSTEDIVEKIIKDKSKDFSSIKDISIYTVASKDKVAEIVNNLHENKKIITFELLNDIHVIHRDYYVDLSDRIKKELEKYHSKNPLKAGMLKEEVRSKFLNNIKSRLAEEFFDYLVKQDIIKQTNEVISLKKFKIEFTDKQEEIGKRIESIYMDSKFTTPKFDEIKGNLDYNDYDIEQVFNALIDLGILMRLKDDIILHKDVYLEGIDIIKKHINTNGDITLADARDILNTSRKYAVAYLEYLDQVKVTKRVEDKRILY